MKRWLILPSILLVFSCAGNRSPPDFLHTDFKQWNDWMNSTVSVDITNVPLGALAYHAPFQEMNIVLHDVDTEYRIVLEAKQVSRRQALWMLANKYGLSLSPRNISQTQMWCIVITNRELRHENKPLK